MSRPAGWGKATLPLAKWSRLVLRGGLRRSFVSCAGLHADATIRRDDRIGFLTAPRPGLTIPSMQLTRRDLLTAVASVSALVAAPRVGEAQSLWRDTMPFPDFGPVTPTRDEFQGQLNQVFRVSRPGQSAYGLRLAAVQDAAAARQAGTVGHQFAFTLMFVGPVADPLPEGTYDMSGGAGAQYELFLKRGAVVNGMQCYEVPFNNPERLDRAFAVPQPKTAS